MEIDLMNYLKIKKTQTYYNYKKIGHILLNYQ